jgi:hypothetical protein
MAATNSTGRRCRVAASLPDAGEDDRELEVAAVVRQQHEMVPERGGSDQEIEISDRRPCGTEATALAPEHLAGLEINADEREAVLLQLVEAFDDRRVSVGRSRMVMVTSWPSGKSSFSTGSRRPPRTRARIVLMSTPPFFSECECLMVSV